MILVIDNYDSFTFNLVQLIGGRTTDILVRRNDQITLAEIGALRPAGILISPGPGRPEEAGITVEVLKTFGRTIPMLGVCLGHQALGHAFGGAVVHAPALMHGRTSMVHHTGAPLFAGVPSPFEATRYHSLVVSRKDLPECLEITAETADGVIMGLRHRDFPIQGVQFHPESILTRDGPRLLENWLEGNT
jgi:anthranilate synthase/aminodeoxychorismate synthase-like glutamine amidotransferase